MGELWSDYCEKAGLYRYQLAFLNITGNVYCALSDHKAAFAIEEKRIMYCEMYIANGKMNDRNILAVTYMNRSITFAQIGKYAEALSDINKSIEIMKEL